MYSLTYDSARLKITFRFAFEAYVTFVSLRVEEIVVEGISPERWLI